MIRVILCMLALLSNAAFLHAQAQCTRAMLKEAAASYIAAQEAGDLSKMTLADEVKYIEDMKETTRDKGLWNSALPIALHRSIYDVVRCKTFSEVIVTEGGHPYVIGTRLKVEDGRVSEIDSLVTDAHDWLFNAEDYLKYSKAEDWRILHLDERVSRQDLIDAGNQYFDFVFLDPGIKPPWGTPCARLEGGMYTNPDGNDRDNCQVSAPMQGGGMFVINRTFVVDEEMGAVNVFCRFGGADGMPDSHLFYLVNGRYRYIHTLSVNPSDEEIDYSEFGTPGEEE